MTIWAIADLHLAFGVPSKTMEAFGPAWENYASRLESAWKGCVKPEDLVLIAGDISWAMTPAQAALDLEWIGQLPGTKVMIKGNHDYWWSSISKVRGLLPPSCHAIQNDAFNWQGVTIAGTRLWDTNEFSFNDHIQFRESALVKEKPPVDLAEQERIFERELQRLEISLKAMDPKAHLRICMTHYPPLGPDLGTTRVSVLLEKYGVDVCVFGHLHSLKPTFPVLGSARGVRYELTAADYLEFKPLAISNAP